MKKTGGTAFIGVAGWTLSRADQVHFPADGTHLQRYAGVFRAAEINSSFYKPHRESTYAKWATQVPARFRFSVKIPKTITHTQKLRDTHALFAEFLPGPLALGDRLGCLLVQLPPSLAFDIAAAQEFFTMVRSHYSGELVCEPRHPTWFDDGASALLTTHRIARVAADPARVPAAAVPGGWNGLAYYRLHGSPRIYYSEYATDYVAALSALIDQSRARGVDVWCVFDNTVLGGASRNALMLERMQTD